MKQLMTLLALLAMTLFGGAGLVGCEEGAFEEAGETVDEAVDDAGDELEDAGDEIEDAIDGNN